LNGNQVVIQGTLKGKTKLAAEEIILAGSIVGNVELRARKIAILSGASIEGNVMYALKKGVDELKVITK
jgi:cytoskeletal protein CcmA (bactofilin family)